MAAAGETVSTRVVRPATNSSPERLLGTRTSRHTLGRERTGQWESLASLLQCNFHFDCDGYVQSLRLCHAC